MSEERFEFGKNWKAFLSTLDQQRIDRSVESLKLMLGTESLVGKSFLDIGCGSGLFSLAAFRLGARVVSIDYDRESVECALQLRRDFSEGSQSPDSNWVIQQGSVLDPTLLDSLGSHDIVYSWGVLHHTGQMDRAIELASQCVSDRGQFFISIYNDQGSGSRRWLKLKQFYNRLPRMARPVLVAVLAGYYEAMFALARLLRGRNPLPFADWRERKMQRGMSVWYDWVDWVGGLPFEVATPQRIETQLTELGFRMVKLETVGKGWGCNEFVFHREPGEATA